ncbi:MAG: class I SAM-dependent methyltransferase [Planctomycetota bacterium]|jgi:SAM-dependent methyltransferase
MARLDPIQWLTRHLEFRAATFGEFFYGRIEQWSPGRLPGINCEFEPANKAHFVTRGKELDYALSVGNGRVMDFGPGDGWPALRIAPMVEHVVGMDASVQRVATCQHNAQQADIKNAEFILVEPGEALPFDDESFDGVVASWSLEETPDLEATLRELLRVMRPGATMRFERVPLSFFTNVDGTPMYVGAAIDQRTLVLIGQPDTACQMVHYCGLLFDLPEVDFRAVFSRHGQQAVYEALTEDVLAELQSHILDAGRWQTLNPQCQAWLDWLVELGFSSAQATYGGAWAAERAFDDLREDERPTSQDEVDALLRPLVKKAITQTAPHDLDTPITAVK